MKIRLNTFVPCENIEENFCPPNSLSFVLCKKLQAPNIYENRIDKDRIVKIYF